MRETGNDSFFVVGTRFVPGSGRVSETHLKPDVRPEESRFRPETSQEKWTEVLFLSLSGEVDRILI